MNITDPIRRHAEQSPDSIAIIGPNSSGITYREFNQTIDAVGRRVLDLGLVPGNTVGVQDLKPYRFVIMTLALARLGIASAPMSLAAELMDACVAASNAAASGVTRLVTVDEIWVKGAPWFSDASPLPSHQDGAAVVRFFPSSGTTGLVKHVAITHDMIVRRVHSRGLVAPLPDSATQISTIGVGSHYGFKNVVRVLWAGGRVVMPGKPEKVASLIERHHVNYLVVAPITLQQIIALMPPGVGPFPSLQTIEFGGSMLPTRLYDLARSRLCPNIVSLYGTTESGVIAAAPMSALVDHPGAIGYVHPSVEIQAVDADDKPLPPGTEGILRVRSDTCVDAYVGDAAASAGAFKGGWFYIGDVGAVSGDGLLTLTGRTGELINIGGNKVSPGVIEDVLLSLAEIREAAAFGAPDASGFTQIWAAIVPNGPVDAATLKAICVERLKENAPRHFMRVKELPRNAAGKILRDKLTRMAIATQAARTSQ
jgi:acyl-CoA synthetase (AMP-forming)/AMP-acid ligase II